MRYLPQVPDGSIIDGTEGFNSGDREILSLVSWLASAALGFIVTHGDPASDVSNSVGGVDFLYRNSQGPSA